MDEREGGFGDGLDPSEKFNGNEAISAVVDDGFIGEEDDDYEDLYNDVNIGEGFLQSIGKSEVGGFADAEEKKADQPEPEPEPQVTPSLSRAGNSAELSTGDGDRPKKPEDIATDTVDGFGSVGFDSSEPGSMDVSDSKRGTQSVPSSMKPEPGQQQQQQQQQQQSTKISDFGIGTGIGGGATVEEVLSVPVGNEGMIRQGVMMVGGMSGFVDGGGVDLGTGVRADPFAVSAGGTILFVGDLHWWTTDAELEAELCKYGSVKELKFFDEKASGKSKGYCQMEFFDPSAAAACKESMNGHEFNGRPCVVAYASPFSVKKMGEAQISRSQQQQVGMAGLVQSRRGGGLIDPVMRNGGAAVSSNYQSGENSRSYGRGGGGGGGGGGGVWGRSNPPVRGSVGLMRNRTGGGGGGVGGRGIMGNGSNGYGSNPILHGQSMMGSGYESGYGGPMGRMGSYGGPFPGPPAPPFSGILSSYPPVGFPGVAPHVNPAFFGRGMPMNGIGMVPSVIDGSNPQMWSDPGMSGWAGDDRAGDEETEPTHDRAVWTAGSAKDKDVPAEKEPAHDRDWPERRHRDDRNTDRDRDRDPDRDRDRSRDRNRERDRHREERDRHGKYRDREPVRDDERGRSSRTHSRSRDDDQRSRSKESEYGKRRRLD